jgi:hypothetical protein
MIRQKRERATLRGKISKKYLHSLKKHEIKRKFICFTYKIEIYFIHEHQMQYFHEWLLLKNINVKGKNIQHTVHKTIYTMTSSP